MRFAACCLGQARRVPLLLLQHCWPHGVLPALSTAASLLHLPPAHSPAGAARHEVLKLQAANREHQAQANRLQLQNEQLRATQGSGVGEALSAGPSPAKRHADATLLQAMVRKQEQ